MRTLSGNKCRLMKKLNRFKTHIFRPRQLLVAESHCIELHYASDRLDHNGFDLYAVNSGPITLSRFKRTRHIILRDFSNNEEAYCNEKSHQYMDQMWKLFMLYGGKL